MADIYILTAPTSIALSTQQRKEIQDRWAATHSKFTDPPKLIILDQGMRLTRISMERPQAVQLDESYDPEFYT